MNSRHRALITKLGLLMVMTLIMLALCGCRTRITNNNEVSNVMYDEDGYMQEEYQMRRDELSLNKANKPLFTGFGGSDQEDYEEYGYGDDSEMLEDYDSEDYDEDTYDPEAEEDQDNPTSPTARRAQNGNGTTSPGTNSRVVRRRVVRRPTQPTSSYVEVVLDANGGKCSASSIKVKVGEKYSSLPKATRSGYDFSGWYTKSSGGTKVTKNTKVTVSRKHKLYAHWKKAKEEEEETPTKPEPTPTPTEVKYTVTYTDGAGGKVFADQKYTCKEGDATPAFSGTPARDGYRFDGEWSPAIADTVTADVTYTAKWVNLYDEWSGELSGTVDGLEDDEKVTYAIHGSDKGDDFLKGAGMSKGEDDSYDTIIIFGTKEDAQNIDNETDNPDGKRILAIPKEAIKGSTKDSAKLLYKFKLFNILYGGYDIDAIAEELGIDDSEDIYDSSAPDD